MPCDEFCCKLHVFRYLALVVPSNSAAEHITGPGRRCVLRMWHFEDYAAFLLTSVGSILRHHRQSTPGSKIPQGPALMPTQQWRSCRRGCRES